MLDVGCGIGRMALPLTCYLEGGSYAGFDVGREMVRWCQRTITPRWPNFEFSWASVYNGKYNPFGKHAGTEFRFPYEDACFDFAFATSLFTHLLRDEVHHYLGETARVLRPGGTCLLTFFLLTPEAEAEIAAGRAMLRLPPPGRRRPDHRPGQPEEAVASRSPTSASSRRGRARGPRADPPRHLVERPRGPHPAGHGHRPPPLTAGRWAEMSSQCSIIGPSAAGARAGDREARRQLGADPRVDRGVEQRVALRGVEAAVEAAHAAVEGDLLARRAGARRSSRP